MDAKDLRIGNYLQGNNVVKVSAILINGKIRIEGNTSIFYIESKHPCIDPIPLTEQWLIDFGFVKIQKPTSMKGVFCTYYKLGDFVVYLLRDSFEVELIKLGEQFNLVINPKLEVHILQNLYFALTNTELNKKK